MGFLAMDAFVGLTEGTNSGLYTLYDGKCDAFLTEAGVTADRTQLTYSGQRSVHGFDVILIHVSAPS